MANSEWAIIENSIVINRIWADKNFIKENYPNAIDLKDFDQPNIGDTFDGEKFIAQVIVPKPVIIEEPSDV